MTHLLASVPTDQRLLTHFAAGVLCLVTVDIGYYFRSTIAELSDNHKTRRALAEMALQSALVSTWQLVLALVLTSGGISAALNRRLYLG